jgi:chromate transport protein ChrA
LGISASVICILHCLLTPALVALVPLLGATGGETWFHAGVIAVVVPVAAWALWNGYRTHRRQRVLWLGGVGTLLISVAVAKAEWETPLMIAAGLILSLAHYFNLKVCAHSHH